MSDSEAVSDVESVHESVNSDSEDSVDSEESFMINESDRDSSEVEEFGIQPYQFEPLLPEVEQGAAVAQVIDQDHPRLNNTDWQVSIIILTYGKLRFVSNTYFYRCNCGYCFVMPTIEESFCCRDTEHRNNRLIEQIGPLNCVIETETFNDIMRQNILNILFDEFREDNFVPAANEMNPYVFHHL